MNKIKQLLKLRLKKAVEELETNGDSLPIEALNLSTKAYNRCHNHGVYTVGQLRTAMLDPIKLLGFAHTYKKSATYQELREVLKS
jgi:hypothetical protein